MFNLKRKVEQIAQQVNQSFEPLRNPKEIIAEIHASFNIASDEILAEAKKIISDAGNVDNGRKLKQAGFNCAKQVDEFIAVDTAEEQARIAQYFSLHYPNNKFITEKKISEICKKYHLLKGEAAYFIGMVPGKNVEDIVNFKLREEDMIVCEVSLCENYGYGYWLNGFNYISDRSITEIKAKKPFLICAPITDFNEHYLARTKVVGGYQIAPLDPVVLQPVSGGYLIVTMWGLESTDESLVNEKMN